MNLWRLFRGLRIFKDIFGKPSEEEVSEYIRKNPQAILKQTPEQKKFDDDFRAGMEKLSQLQREGMGDEAYEKWMNGDPEGRRAYEEWKKGLEEQ